MSRKWLVGLLIIGFAVFALIGSNQSSPHPGSSITSSDSSESLDSAPSITDADPPAFAGDPCTSDCSGHQAGYDWAEEKGIDDVDDCDTAGDNSNSPSFAEGCKAYVNGISPDEDGDQDSDSDN